MKKFLAVVLALVMALSMGTAAFAYVEVAPGQIYIGPADAVYYANPGEAISLAFRYAGSPLESDGYPSEGYAVIPFMGAIGDVNSNVVTNLALTQEAIDAGVSFIVNEGSAYHTFYTPEDGLLFGSIMMPVSLLASDFNVFTVDTTISADWVVVDYVAETPIDIQFFAGDTYMPGMIVTNEEAAAIAAGEMLPEEAVDSATIYNVITDYTTIQAKPYEPTFWESVEEQLKGIGAAILDVLMIGINLLKGELAPSDWYVPGEHDVLDLSFITDAIASLVGSLL